MRPPNRRYVIISDTGELVGRPKLLDTTPRPRDRLSIYEAGDAAEEYFRHNAACDIQRTLAGYELYLRCLHADKAAQEKAHPAEPSDQDQPDPPGSIFEEVAYRTKDGGICDLAMAEHYDQRGELWSIEFQAAYHRYLAWADRQTQVVEKGADPMDLAIGANAPNARRQQQDNDFKALKAQCAAGDIDLIRMDPDTGIERYTTRYRGALKVHWSKDSVQVLIARSDGAVIPRDDDFDEIPF